MPAFVIKLIYLISISALCISCDPSQGNNTSEIGKLILSGDSGFVTKAQALPFLIASSLTDTTKSFWNQAQPHDTIGKYYKIAATGNYVYCSVDLSRTYSFETHLLIELSKEGNILKTERYFHGQYPCCWDNYYSGFNKLGNYFSMETCQTGSGYCASNLYLFKTVLPQDKQQSIPNSCWNSNATGGLAYALSSEPELRNDSLLIMHYKTNTDTIDGQMNYTTVRTTSFDIDFIYRMNRWMVKDSTKLHDLSVNLLWYANGLNFN